MRNFKLIGLALGIAMSSASVFAVPTLNTLVVGADPILDNNVIGFQLTDTDGINDDSNAYLFIENAGYASSNTFGFYSWADPSKKLTVFDGANSAGVNSTVSFGLGGVSTSTFGVETLTNYEFGLWLTSPEGTFYSNPLLNADGVDHFAIFSTEGSTGLAGVFEFVIGIEDVYGGGDLDYNDMVLGITDVRPLNQVPVIGTAALLPLGLFGLGLARRRVAV